MPNFIVYKNLNIINPDPNAISAAGGKALNDNFKYIGDRLELGVSGYSGYSGVSGFSGRSGFSGYSGLANCCFIYHITASGAGDVNFNKTFTLTRNGVNTWTDLSDTLNPSPSTITAVGSDWQLKLSYFNGTGTASYIFLADRNLYVCPPRDNDGQGWNNSSNSAATPFPFISLDSCFDGAAGATGSTGISGYSGISGFSGYSGISGFSGFSGKSGFSGFSGISGFSGYSGVSGYSGYSGVSGFSGFSGVSGYSGYSGVSGYSGYSGVSGFSGTTDTLPVGAVVAWLKSFTNTPALPANFVECNGQTLSDAGSVYNGQVIPNLNGSASTKRFLRGSTTSGTTGGADTVTPAGTIAGPSATASVTSGAQTAAGPTHTHVFTGTSASYLPSYYEVVFVLRIK